MHRTKDFFEHHGPKTIVLARFVPVVRTFAPILAGVGEMPYGTFIRYNVVGGFIWSVGLITAGRVLGETIPSIDKYLLPIIFVIVLLSLIPPFIEWRKHRRPGRTGVGRGRRTRSRRTRRSLRRRELNQPA